MILALLLFGCKKDKENTPSNPVPTNPALNVSINFKVDQQPLIYDSILYVNEAGNPYSVTRCQFYLSQIKLIREDSQTVDLKAWHYVDANVSSTCHINSSEIPEGNYIGMSFNMGLDATLNVPDGLPATSENLGMEWPVAMGGGYHFLKLEGKFTDSPNEYGYAMHLGMNMTLCPVTVYGNFCVGTGCTNPNLVMNINEWFRNPNTYDFNVDGNYIMGDMTNMMKISQNGVDVFTVE